MAANTRFGSRRLACQPRRVDQRHFEGREQGKRGVGRCRAVEGELCRGGCRLLECGEPDLGNGGVLLVVADDDFE